MKRNQSGFTIIELLLASAILLVAITASMGVIAASMRGLSQAKQREAAANFTRTASNLIRNTSYTDLSAAGLVVQLRPIWQQQSGMLGQGATYSVKMVTEANDTNGIPILVKLTCNVKKGADTLSEVDIRVSNRGINP